MKSTLLTVALFAIFFCLSEKTTAQDKNYARVYVEKKEGGNWSGTIKTNFTAKLTREETGEGPVTFSIIDGSTSYKLTANFEAINSEGKSFHTVVGGVVYGEPIWKSHTGSSKINWVFLNKSIHAIYGSDAKPFDLEIQFDDGSAVKYYVSP